MSIEPVNPAATASYASQIRAKQPEASDSPVATPAAPSNQDTVSISAGTNRPAMERLNTHVEGQNALAKALKESVAGLEQVPEALMPLKSELYRIIKNYPPFGMNSEERRDILRSYSALRKEIDSMTVPAPPPPFYELNSSTLSRYFDSEGRVALQDLPVLSTDSPDGKVHDAAAAIDSMIDFFQASPKAIQNLLEAG